MSSLSNGSKKARTSSHTKKERKVNEKTSQEAKLESFLFGDAEHIETDPLLGHELRSLSSSSSSAASVVKEEEDEDSTPDFGFQVDVVGSKRKSAFADEDDEDDESSSKPSIATQASKPAWNDEDDEKVLVDVASVSRLRKLRAADNETTVSGAELASRLRAQHELMNSKTEWAKLPESAGASSSSVFDDDETSTAFLSSNSQLLGVSTGKLPQGQLQITRMRDANQQEPSQSTVNCVEFHPNGQLMLTAGLDKTLRMFQIDGLRNPKVQSVFFEDLPITCASFTPDGHEVILSGRRKFLYSYDIEAGAITKIPYLKGRVEKSWERLVVSPANDYLALLGQDGHTVLVSRSTKQVMHSLKMSGTVRNAAFAADGHQLFTSGDDGQVFLWDIRNLRAAHRFVDEGCIHSTSLAVSATGGYLATGSNSGVVNLYSAEQALSSVQPKPLKAIMNLTTRVDDLLFNHDAQILAISSKRKKDAFRLMHLPSNTVFSNWPTSQTPLSYVQCCAFTPSSGYLAIGNDKGKVLLYRLNHFTSS